MQKKLTLRMDAALIERAKAYAEEQGTSLSKLVADYFTAVAVEKEGAASEDDDALGPITRSLGAVPSRDVDEEDYYRYLEEKHR